MQLAIGRSIRNCAYFQAKSSTFWCKDCLVIKLSNPFETLRLRCVKSTWNLYVRTSLNWVLMGAGTQFIGVVVPRMSVQ